MTIAAPLGPRRNEGRNQSGCFAPAFPLVGALVFRAIAMHGRDRRGHTAQDLYGIITDIDAGSTAMLSWTCEDMIGGRSLEFLR